MVYFYDLCFLQMPGMQLVGSWACGRKYLQLVKSKVNSRKYALQLDGKSADRDRKGRLKREVWMQQSVAGTVESLESNASGLNLGNSVYFLHVALGQSIFLICKMGIITFTMLGFGKH